MCTDSGADVVLMRSGAVPVVPLFSVTLTSATLRLVCFPSPETDIRAFVAFQNDLSSVLSIGLLLSADVFIFP